MAKTSLVGYSVKIRKKGSKRNYLNLYSFNGTTDLFNILSDYFSYYSPTSSSNTPYSVYNVPNTDNKTIWIEDVDVKKGDRVIQGVIRTGEYGYRYPIVNYQNHKLSYMKKKDDAELIPLSFLLYIPNKGDTPLEKMGIAIFQRFKKNSLKGIFQSHFQDYFYKRFPDYILEMIPLTPEEVIQSFTNGVITSAKLIAHSVPDDIADYHFIEDDSRGKVILGFEKVKFTKKFKDYIIKIIKGELSTKNIIESEWMSVDEIKTTVKINGAEKTFTIKEEGAEITPGIDISDNISSGDDGFPTKQDVDREALDYLDTLKSYLVNRNDH